MKNSHFLLMVVATVCLGIGFGAGIIISGGSSDQESPSEVHQKNSGYSFINPLLTCETEPIRHIPNNKLSELDERLTGEINTAIADGRLIKGGVYFREFKTGPWIGVNEDLMFTPGSLLKVPLAMSIYKHSESDPKILNTPVEYVSGDQNTPQHFPPPQAVAPGHTYTVSALMDTMLKYSDNNAADILTKVISDKELFGTYSDLGIMPPTFGQDYQMKIRDYASFFRILYNATYLDKSDSEQMLKTLSGSSFVQGIPSGVPEGTVVAHKFGERSLGDGSAQLHDCGVVYYPNQPYLLCIMLQGSNFDSLASEITAISRLAYSYVDESARQ